MWLCLHQVVPYIILLEANPVDNESKPLGSLLHLQLPLTCFIIGTLVMGRQTIFVFVLEHHHGKTDRPHGIVIIVVRDFFFPIFFCEHGLYNIDSFFCLHHGSTQNGTHCTIISRVLVIISRVLVIITRIA